MNLRTDLVQGQGTHGHVFDHARRQKRTRGDFQGLGILLFGNGVGVKNSV
jgi:hypothetical protein